MSEQSPVLDRDDLREHGNKARTKRVWERLERNIALSAPSTAAKPKRRFPLVAAAIAAGFAGGFLSSNMLDDAPAPSSPVVVAPANDEAAREVFAAGSEARSYPLPGGGTLHVAPGTIVDTVVRGRNGMTLRLVRGEATLTTPPSATAGRLALEVGNAQVDTTDGSLRVRLDGDSADLQVISGTAGLTTPDEDVKHRVLTPSKRRLRVRVTVASNDQTPTHVPGPLAVADDDVDVDDEAVEATDEAPVVEAWVLACNEAEYDKAAKLILGAEGGMEAQLAKAPQHRSCISSGLEEGNKSDAAIAFNLRTLSDPSTSNSQQMFAASNLARLYRDKGDSGRAREYQARFNTLSKGTALYSESGLCENIQTAYRTGKPTEFARMVTDYRSTYPDGDCTDTIAGLEKELKAKQAAAKAKAESEPAADDEPKQGEENPPSSSDEDAYEGE